MFEQDEVMNDMFIVWLNRTNCHKLSLLGGKALNLVKLNQAGVTCPVGFCVSAEAYDFYLEKSGLRRTVSGIVRNMDMSSVDCASMIRHVLQQVGIPKEVKNAVTEAHHEMEQLFGYRVPLAVRSSATGEDSVSYSFAGQFDSFLGVVGEQDLIMSLQHCWMSLFNARSIAYARRNDLGSPPLSMAVIVQKLVSATKAGVIFTDHPVASGLNQMIIEAVFGLGERLVSGRSSPDTYVLSKEDFSTVRKIIGREQLATLFDAENEELVEREVDPGLGEKTVMNQSELKELGHLGKKIEKIFGHPQDIEWAMEGNKFYIVQTRPITSH